MIAALRTFLRRNILAPGPAELSRLDLRDGMTSLGITPRDWSYRPEIDGPRDDPWAHVSDPDRVNS